MMDPIAGTIVHAPEIEVLTDGMAKTYYGRPCNIELHFVLQRQGANPSDYSQTLIVDKLTSLEFEQRSIGLVAHLEGFSAQSEAIPRGRFVRIHALNLIAQTGELFISDFAP